MQDTSKWQAARLLAELYSALPADLAKVRKRYIGRNSRVASEHLSEVQAALTALLHAIERDDEIGWAIVERANALLKELHAPASRVAPADVAAELGAPPSASSASASSASASSASAPIAPSARHTVSMAHEPNPRPALPFQGQGSPPAPLVAQVDVSRGQTATLSTPRLAAHSGAPLPFSNDGALPRLTVQQYAQLCAQLANRPQDKSRIHERFGIAGDAIQHELDERWKAQLASDQTSQKLFTLLYQRLRSQSS